MSFLTPAALGWLALALPIIALYLIRTRLERRGVSTLLFWDQLKTQSYNSALWRKLRRWLSLLLQLLFLCLLAFALAQPLAPWQSIQPARTVFILDPSTSMQAKEGGVTRWERSIQALEQRIRQMRSFDRAAVLVASDPPQVLSGWTASKRVLLEALKKAQATGGAPSLRPVLDLAGNLRSSQANANVRFLTDGVWKETEGLSENVQYEWIGQPQPNAGVTHFSARRSFSSPDEVRVSGEVVSQGEKPLEGSVELLRDGRLLDVQTVELKPGVPWTREWDVRSKEASRFELKLVGFPEDAMPGDDVAGVSVAAVAAVRVLLVSDPNPYLEAALNALPLVEWARVENVTGYPDPDVLYVFNRAAPPAGFENARSLLINPVSGGYWGQPKGAVEDPLVSEMDKEHPLLRHTGFANVRLDAAAKWEPPKHSKVFADSFGDPLIYGEWTGSKHWALFAFDLEASDLVLRTAFPILLGNAVESLRPTQSYAASEAAGRTESSLIAAKVVESETVVAEAPPAPSWWFAFPLWWWAVLVGCLWLLLEWRFYTRRITE